MAYPHGVGHTLKVFVYHFHSVQSLDHAGIKPTSSNANVKADTHLTELIVSTLMSALQTHIYVVTKHRALILLVVIRALVQMATPVMAEHVLILMSARLQITTVQKKRSVQITKA